MRVIAGTWILLLLSLPAVGLTAPSSAEARARETQAEFIERWAQMTAGTAQRILERSETAPPTPLGLEVMPAQPRFPLFAPVTLLVRLSNGGAQPVEGNYQLDESSGRLFVYVAGPDGDFVPYMSRAFIYAQVSDMEVPRTALPPGASITQQVSLVYNHVTKSRAFPTSGTYRVKAVFAYRTDYSLVSSETVELQIANPAGADANASSLLAGDEEARVLQGESTDPKAIANLRRVTEQWPDTDYALCAAAALLALPPETSGFASLAADRPLGPHHRALLERAISAASDKSRGVAMRIAAARRLGVQFGHKDAIPVLATILGDHAADKGLRLQAVVALSQIPDKGAVPPLLDAALEDPDDDVRELAASQLRSMGVMPRRDMWTQQEATWVPTNRWRLLSDARRRGY